MVNLKKVTVFVWNFYTHDARVKRECTTLARSDYYVNLIALKNIKDDKMEIFQKITNNFDLYRIKKYSILFYTISKNKMFYLILSIILNLILLVTSFHSKILLYFLSCVFIMEILFISVRNIRTFFVNFSTIVRMTIKGYFDKADIYHANDLNTLPQAIICAKFRFKPRPLIYDSHEVQSDRTGYNKSVVKVIESFLLNFIDCMIVENDTRAKYNFKLYGFRPKVLHNYSDYYNIDNYPNANIHKIISVDSQEKILLYQGGIQVGRGLDKLIDAMNLIKEGHLVFIGDGNEKERLRERAGKSQEKKRIHFIDKVPLNELPSYTKEAFIGFQVLQNICFNHFSASSNKLFEYIMAGIPVIACNFPEISKIVNNNKVGIVIDSHNPQEIAIAVNKLIDDCHMHQNMKKNTVFTRKVYNWQKEKNNLLNIYSHFNKKISD